VPGSLLLSTSKDSSRSGIKGLLPDISNKTRGRNQELVMEMGKKLKRLASKTNLSKETKDFSSLIDELTRSKGSMKAPRPRNHPLKQFESF